MTDLETARQLLADGRLTANQFDAWKLANVNRLSIRAIAAGTRRSKTTIADLIDTAQRKIDDARRDAA